MRIEAERLGAKNTFSSSEDRLGRRSHNSSGAPAPLAPPPAAPLAPRAPSAVGTEAETSVRVVD